MIQLHAHHKLLFIGDSITDAGRSEYFGANLGQGYVNMIAGHLYRQYPMLQLEVINQGVGGDTLNDLLQRWQSDCLAYQPDILSLFIGVNDLWHSFSNSTGYNETKLTRFKDHYSYLLTSVREQNPDSQIILLEPYAMPEPAKRLEWTEYLHKMSELICNLSEEYNGTFVPLHQPLLNTGKNLGYAQITGQDGIHPTTLGHALIADYWLRAAGL